MTKNGGARPGAGRPQGALNRRSSEVLAAAVSDGITPVEYMLAVLRDETADPGRRAWAAEKAAPFVHPRPSPAERPIQLALPSTDTIEGINRALDVVIQAMGNGEISPGEGQSLISVVEARRKAIETGDILQRLEALEQALENASAARR